MSKARQKGTQYENRVRDRYLRPIWPSADRAPLRGTADIGDFDGTPLVVEAKKRNAWRLPDWIRTTQRKAVLEGRPWAIVFAGDKRLKDLQEDYVCTTAEHYFGQYHIIEYLRSELDKADDTIRELTEAL